MNVTLLFRRLLPGALLAITLYAHGADNFNLADTQAKAATGDPEAEFLLGRAYAHGQGVPINMAKAAALFEQSANQGNAKAQNNLGALYLHGTGVKADPVIAMKWFQKSADQGAALGEMNVGLCYL